MAEKEKRPRRSKFTAIDLFAGCGGLTEGLKGAGFLVIGAIEKDKTAASTYSKNHPNVELFDCDIKRVSAIGLMRKLGLRKGQLDLLAGCPPCQGFSTMRTLNGARTIRDRQNKLLFQYLRFVKVLRPKTLMLENVPGLARNRRFRLFLKTLTRMGYHHKKSVLNAADYNVPQRRRRLILIASSTGPGLQFGKRSRTSPTVRTAIGDMRNTTTSNDSLHNYSERRSEKIKKLIKAVPKDGGSRRDLPKRTVLNCHRNCDGFKDVYGRMTWDEVSPTITSGCTNPSKGRFIHPSKNRAITLREAAVLQTFRQNYFFDFSGGRSGVALMIGNALPPEFIRRHALAIKKVLQIVTS